MTRRYATTAGPIKVRRDGRVHMTAVVAAAVILLSGAACTAGRSTATSATSTTVPTAVPSTTTTSTPSTTVLQPASRRVVTPTTAAALPSRPCCSTTPGGPLRVAFAGLTPGQRVPNDGREVAFSVTYTNPTSTNYPSVEPVVTADHYDGAHNPTSSPQGRLQRYNPGSGTWDDIPVAVGTGMDYMYAHDAAAFDLAPGHSASFQYRMSLTPDDAPGTLMIDGIAANTSDHSDVGNIGVPIAVVTG